MAVQCTRLHPLLDNMYDSNHKARDVSLRTLFPGVCSYSRAHCSWTKHTLANMGLHLPAANLSTSVSVSFLPRFNEFMPPDKHSLRNKTFPFENP
eukprot:5975905-Amphidinium_carterae.2